jgi:hypothetical protein
MNVFDGQHVDPNPKTIPSNMLCVLNRTKYESFTKWRELQYGTPESSDHVPRKFVPCDEVLCDMWRNSIHFKRKNLGLEDEGMYEPEGKQPAGFMQTKAAAILDKATNLFSKTMLKKDMQNSFSHDKYSTAVLAEKAAAEFFNIPFEKIPRLSDKMPFTSITAQALVSMGYTLHSLWKEYGVRASDLAHFGIRSFDSLVGDFSSLVYSDIPSDEIKLVQSKLFEGEAAKKHYTVLNESKVKESIAREVCTFNANFGHDIDGFLCIGMSAQALLSQKILTSFIALSVVPLTPAQMRTAGYSFIWLHMNMGFTREYIGAWCASSTRAVNFKIPCFQLNDWTDVLQMADAGNVATDDSNATETLSKYGVHHSSANNTGGGMYYDSNTDSSVHKRAVELFARKYGKKQ